MNPTLKNGVVTGTIVAIFAISFFSAVNALNTAMGWGFQPDNIRGIGGLLTILLLGTGIYITMQTVKNEQNDSLTYAQALKTGISVAVITAIITALGSLIYCTLINPGYANYMVAEAQKVIIASGETQQQIAKHSLAVKNEYSTAMQVMQALVGQSVVGTVLSLIMGLFLKTKK